MRALSEFAHADVAKVRGVFADIDDTITTDGRLMADAYAALQALYDAGLWVVPVTGRPAGWCDHIARMWPVTAVVGENGAFYFHYDRVLRKMRRRFLNDEATRADGRAQLAHLAKAILAQIPGTALASDQGYREADLAIDFCEDVAPLDDAAVRRIVTMFEQAGASAKVSSIHVNGWFGDYDKLGMTRILASECLELDLEQNLEQFVYIGDSPNDAPMFEFFPNSVGVSNVNNFAGQMAAEPRFITASASGDGFCELANYLLR